MRRKVILSTQAPTPGPGWSQAIAIEGAQRLTWFSAVGEDPHATTDVVLEADTLVDHLQASLDAAGLSSDNVVRLTLHLVDLGQLPVLERALARIIGERPPARTVLGVAALPGGARFSVDAVAAS